MGEPGTPTTVLDALRDVAALLEDAGVDDTARLDAELLVGHVAGLDRVGLRVHSDNELAPSQWQQLDELVGRRAAGEPVAYLLGTAWFYGREFEVEDDDGELATGSGQANQLDAFQERNYGVFTSFERPFGSGHSWEVELTYDQTDFEAEETNWEDDLDFDLASIGIDDVDDILPFLGQSNNEINSIFAAVPHQAAQLRDPVTNPKACAARDLTAASRDVSLEARRRDRVSEDAVQHVARERRL